MSYTPYTPEERINLQKLLAKRYSFRKIAEILGRSPSSVSREVRRNCSKKPKSGVSDNEYCYHAWRAQTLSIMRRRSAKHYRLQAYTDEWEYIVWGLSQYWTPEEIVRRWGKENPSRKHFGVSTIYRAIKRDVSQYKPKNTLEKTRQKNPAREQRV